jgi:hypothetical protein
VKPLVAEKTKDADEGYEQNPDTDDRLFVGAELNGENPKHTHLPLARKAK